MQIFSEDSKLCRMTTLFTALLLSAFLFLAPASGAPNPWYQGGKNIRIYRKGILIDCILEKRKYRVAPLIKVFSEIGFGTEVF